MHHTVQAMLDRNRRERVSETEHRWERIAARRSEGWTFEAIGREMGLSTSSVAAFYWRHLVDRTEF